MTLDWDPNAGTVGLESRLIQQGNQLVAGGSSGAVAFTSTANDTVDKLSVFLGDATDQDATLLAEVYPSASVVPTSGITTTTYRPNGDLQIGGVDSEQSSWATSSLTTTNLSTRIDEAVLDVTDWITYFAGSAARYRYRFNLATAGALWPANQRVVGGRVKVVANREEVNGRLEIFYYDATTSAAYSLGTVTATQKRATLSVQWPEYNPATRLPWTRAEIQALDAGSAIQFRTIGVGKQKNLFVYQAWLELDWVTESRVAIGTATVDSTAIFYKTDGSPTGGTVDFSLQHPNTGADNWAKATATDYTILLRRIRGTGLPQWRYLAETQDAAEAVGRPTAGSVLPVDSYIPLLDNRGFVSDLGDVVAGRALAFVLTTTAPAVSVDGQPYAAVNTYSADSTSTSGTGQTLSVGATGSYSLLRFVGSPAELGDASVTVTVENVVGPVAVASLTLSRSELDEIGVALPGASDPLLCTAGDCEYEPFLYEIEFDTPFTLTAGQRYEVRFAIDATGYFTYTTALAMPVAGVAISGLVGSDGPSFGGSTDNAAGVDQDALLTLSTQPFPPIGFGVTTRSTPTGLDAGACTVEAIDRNCLGWNVTPAGTEAITATNLLYEEEEAPASPFVTDSVSPSEDSLVVLWMFLNWAGQETKDKIAITTVSGCGLDWELLTVVSANEATAQNGLFFFVAQGTPTPGPITVTTPGGWTKLRVMLTEYEGVHVGASPLDCIRQFPQYNGAGNANSWTYYFDPLANTSNRAALFAFQSEDDGGGSVEAGWNIVTKTREPNGMTHLVALSNAGITDEAVTVTWDAGVDTSNLGLVMELVPEGIDLTVAPWAPVFHKAGAATTATGAATIAWPHEAKYALIDHTQVLGVIVIETRDDEPPNVASLLADGWAYVSGSPDGVGAAGASTRHTVLWKEPDATEADVVVGTGGGHVWGGILLFRNTRRGVPFNVTAASEKAVTSTAVSIAGVTTTEPNTHVAYISARQTDSDASGEANASLDALRERFEMSGASGGGNGMTVWSGTKTPAGATGTLTATLTATSVEAYLAFALLSQVGYPPSGDDLAYWEIERQADDWDTIAVIADEAAIEFCDWEARRGVAEPYRMRSVRSGDYVGSTWTPTITATAVLYGSEVVIASNHAQDAVAFERSPDYEWDEINDDVVVGIIGSDGRAILAVAEDRGQDFTLPLIVFAGSDETPTPTTPGRVLFTPLRDFLRVDTPLFAVCDADGWRAFGHCRLVSSTRTEDASLYLATVEVNETAFVPTPYEP